MLRNSIAIFLLLVGVYFELVTSYSALEDARLIKEYKRQVSLSKAWQPPFLNHAKVARKLVNQATWAATGTISTKNVIKNYPMVNVVSINDNDAAGKSTGHIQFLLTDLDFTGTDWHHDNNVTMLFTQEQSLECTKMHIDPMQPTCQRAIVSGRVYKVDTKSDKYAGYISAFIKKHPDAKEWLRIHNFYLCELLITNIFVLDFFGGAKTVSPADYYNVNMDDEWVPAVLN